MNIMVKKIISIHLKKIMIVSVFIIYMYTFSVNVGVAKQICASSIPIFPDATSIEEFIDDQAKVISKSYIVHVKYPPDKIIDFYKSKMKELKFTIDDNDKSTTQRWISYEDQSSGEAKLIRQYSQAWINKERSKKALLVLTYESKNKGLKTEKLHVTIQIMPLYDDTLIDKFLNELRSNGRYEKFMRLLESYSTENQNIDFETAIRENPENTDLKIYRDLLRDITEGQ